VAVDLTALRELCARSLTGFKRPTDFFVVEAIAKNAVGKIDKASLRAAHVAVS
jgi:acyl-CoA synthetase (AMP-forming)/AMP-acid ligase II